MEVNKDLAVLNFKTVERRVSDTLNVFNALGIVKKERNLVKFKGGPLKFNKSDSLMHDRESTDKILTRKQKLEKLKNLNEKIEKSKREMNRQKQI